MNIIVCVKQVPDTNEVRIDPVKGTLIREGVPAIMNPDDKAGLEAALELKDRLGAKVTALSMGPAQADAVLREALAMGADEGILISDRAFGGADTWATSSTLAAAISTLPYDLIITGRQAIDGDTAQVGPEIAEHLNLPHISYASAIDVSGGTLIVRQALDDREQVVRAALPALVTALGGMNQPRYMTPGGIFEAFREKEIRVLRREDVPVDETNIGLAGSPTKVKRSFPKAVKAPGMTIERDADESAQFILDKLREKYLL